MIFCRRPAFEGTMCIKLKDLPQNIQTQIAAIWAEITAEKELWERRDAALRELEQKYKTDEPVFGAMYMTPFGTLIDCSIFPNGHAEFRSGCMNRGWKLTIGRASRHSCCI